MGLRRLVESKILQGFGALPPAVQRRLGARHDLERDGQRLAPELALLLQIVAMRGGPGLTDLPVGPSRRKYRRDVLTSSGTPVAVGEVRDLEVAGAAGPLPARLYTPVGGSAALLVFLHGGGFVLGDLETHDAPCRWLCREGGFSVLSVAYRLAPEHLYPAAIDDSCAAFTWARAQFGATCRIGVGGDSAGGHLAAAVAQRLTGADGPEVQLLLYPAIDRVDPWPSLELFAHGLPLTRKDVLWFEEQSSGTVADVRGSLLKGRTLSGLAPAIVATAHFDPLRDEGDAYARALRAAGTPVVYRRYHGLAHGFVHLLGYSRTSRAALTELAQLTAAQLGVRGVAEVAPLAPRLADLG